VTTERAGGSLEKHPNGQRPPKRSTHVTHSHLPEAQLPEWSAPASAVTFIINQNYIEGKRNTNIKTKDKNRNI
jgi:hypothetical protein